MAKRKQKKSFPARHKKGWISAGIFLVVWIIVFRIYEIFRVSFEAGIATNQVNDSVVQYSLIQRMMYGDLGPGLINTVFLLLIILCLIPTAKDLIKNNT